MLSRLLPGLILLLSPLLATAAPATRLSVAILPPAADRDGADLALLLQTRAAGLLTQTGRYQEIHLKQILRVAEQSATKVRTAFTACKYSHRTRSSRQSSGATVQSLVAWFAG